MKNLTFVAFTDSSKNFWSPERPPDYADACSLGRDYAAELHRYMEVTGQTVVFGAVIRAMIESGEWTGVEAGFCQAFAVSLVGVEFASPVSAVPKAEAIG